jgi:hypothetical protein
MEVHWIILIYSPNMIIKIQSAHFTGAFSRKIKTGIIIIGIKSFLGIIIIGIKSFLKIRKH